jgi:hypothetical protein
MAASGILFFDPRAKPLSTAGAFQSGAYFCFFSTGTTTPTNVYADGALTTPLSQPAPASVNPTGGTVAASDGRLVPIYLNPATTYRVQLYNAAGTLLEDTDPYVVPGIVNFTSAFIGGVIYPQTPAEAAAGITVGASPGNITNQIYPPGHVFRYGAKGDGTTNDAVAIQAAINQSGNAAIGAAPAYAPGGQFLLGSTGLLLVYGCSLIGAGMQSTYFLLTGVPPNAAIDAYANSASFSYLANFSISVQGSATGAYALRFGNKVQNIRMDHVAGYYSAGASSASAFINFNGNSSSTDTFSGLFSAISCYGQGFHYGFLFQNSTGNKKWTTLSFIGCQLLGDLAAGSIGIWEDGNSDNVGSVFHGGTISNFAKPYQLDSPGNSGMHIDADIEGNTNSGTVYANASFSHRLPESVPISGGAGEPVWWWQDGAAGGANIYYRYQNWVGALIEEFYKSHDRVLLSDSGSSLRAAVRAGTSLINGGTPTFVDGVTVQPSAPTNPALNYAYQSNGVNRVTWSNAAPGGGTWSQGDICWNSAATVGSPKGWSCTVAGTPGTWVSQGNL